MNYSLYTDGAYSRKHDEGAFAYIILNPELQEIKSDAKKISQETNNRAELKAILAGVHNLPEDAEYVEVLSDSKYALGTLFMGWKREKNIDLFEVWENVRKQHPDVKFHAHWIPGHHGNKFNEQCDKMCSDVLGYDCNKEFEKYKKYRQNVMLPGIPIFKD